jgi:hypothetical protein
LNDGKDAGERFEPGIRIIIHRRYFLEATSANNDYTHDAKSDKKPDYRLSPLLPHNYAFLSPRKIS